MSLGLDRLGRIVVDAETIRDTIDSRELTAATCIHKVELKSDNACAENGWDEHPFPNGLLSRPPQLES